MFECLSYGIRIVPVPKNRFFAFVQIVVNIVNCEFLVNITRKQASEKNFNSRSLIYQSIFLVLVLYHIFVFLYFSASKYEKKVRISKFIWVQ